jgi:hypothetical protein
MPSQRAFHFPFGLTYRPPSAFGMAHIRLDDKEIELKADEPGPGADDDAGVRFGSASSGGNLAIIALDARGTATVRRATSGVTILGNGVALGAEPAPLLHGDRIEVAGRQLRFSDDRKAGSTVLMPAFSASARTTAAPQGGRVGLSIIPPHPRRATAARPVVASGPSKPNERLSSHEVPSAAWLAATVVIGATVLLLLRDR